jgi:uncharacterized phage protein gp47/JayE
MAPLSQIDYTNKDYASLRRAMLDLARYRLPEWSDRSEADLGMLFVDLFAYMGDIILYYQDRIANESFLHTATERRSVMHLLRLIGYNLKPPIAAHADLRLSFKVQNIQENAPVPDDAAIVVIPHGAQFGTKGGGIPAQPFEYLGPTLQINLNSSEVVRLSKDTWVYENLPVRHSRPVVDEILGSSTGEPNQSFRLAQSPIIPESLIVQVNDGSGWVEWQQRENFLYYTESSGLATVSTAESQDYIIQTDENDQTFILFGDGVYSQIPAVGANNIRASYRVGGGSIGNVPAGTITEIRTPIASLNAVTNPTLAAGGTDREAINHAVQFGPLAYRSGQRAVTLNDFVALAHQAGGVAKVRARPRSWNRVDLYIAPEGDTARAAPESLKRRLLAYFEQKRMVGMFVTIQDPILVPIDVGVEVIVEQSYNAEQVRQSVENTVRSLLDFQNVDFGQVLYLSKVYEAVEALPGVYAATVIRFNRQNSALTAFETDLTILAGQGVRIPESIQRAVRSGLNAEGRIAIEEFEIPIPGNLAITLRELVS